jgi:ParB family chromosome partitioning protein
VCQDTREEVQLLQIPPEVIDTNPEQPRRRFTPEALEALVQSIARHGILQPLIVRDGIQSGRYELVAGERRLRAAMVLGLQRVPAVRRHVPDERLLEVALVENIQRESLDSIEEAEAYRSLIDRYGYTQESVAERVGRSRSTVANALRLLDLPDVVKAATAAGTISAGHARALAGLPTAQAQKDLCDRVVAEGMSVRETEACVARIKRPGRPPRQPRGSRRPPYLQPLEDRLRRRLGTKVKLHQSGRQAGRIEIHFHSDEEFERLLEFF